MRLVSGQEKELSVVRALGITEQELPMEQIPDLIIVSNANTDDQSLSEHRNIHWRHAKHSIELLGKFIVATMPELSRVEIISTAQNRAALTANFAVRVLDQTAIEVKESYIWKLGSIEYRDLRNSFSETMVDKSIADPTNLTVLFGNKSTIRNYDPESFLDNYAQIAAVKDGKKIAEIAPGYLM